MTSTANTAPDSSTDANFRAWGSPISAALAAVGLVQTPDTGQINWATVLKPAAANTVAGYEMWRFADALQATSPFFFKIEYGSSAAGAVTPGIWVTTGTGSNGTGAITNPSARQAIHSTGNSVGLTTCFFSGGTNRFSMVLWASIVAAPFPLILSIERSHDTTGADTGEYLSFVSNYQNNQACWAHLSTGAVITEAGNLPSTFTSLLGTLAVGSVALLPITPVIGYARPPLRGAICGRFNDWTNGETDAITLYPGVTDTYIVIKAAAASSSGIFGIAGQQNYVAIVRFN